MGSEDNHLGRVPARVWLGSELTDSELARIAAGGKGGDRDRGWAGGGGLTLFGASPPVFRRGPAGLGFPTIRGR
jgi:hypothetical protein